jgi:tetratricopeptide (TPR) repeat protein
MTQMAGKFLDADELLHLALNAAGAGNNEEALVKLKRALEIAPNDARVHYVLGSMYTQLGLIDRATKHLQHAVVFDPSMETARFRLGWIQLNTGTVDAAAETWKAFDGLGKEHPLYLVKTGLLHLAKNELVEAEKFLRLGIAANTIDAQFNYDMAQIHKQIVDHLEASKSVAPQAAPKPDAAPKAQASAPKSDAAPAPKPAAPAKRRLDAYREDDRDEKGG